MNKTTVYKRIFFRIEIFQAVLNVIISNICNGGPIHQKKKMQLVSGWLERGRASAEQKPQIISASSNEAAPWQKHREHLLLPDKRHNCKAPCVCTTRQCSATKSTGPVLGTESSSGATSQVSSSHSSAVYVWVSNSPWEFGCRWSQHSSERPHAPTS